MPRRSSLHAFVAAMALFALGCGPAHADTLDDNLQTVWESLWLQNGTPRPVFRWNKPITYRIHGPDSARHAEHLRSALQAAAGIAGIALTDVSAQADADSAASLDLEVVSDTALRDNEPCVTRTLRSRNTALEKVRVSMRSSDAWRCTYHEMMHAMGIVGHPSGKTVLSYFPYRRDALMDLDRLMLAAWYSPAMKLGATPLEALVVLADAVRRQPDLGVPPEQAADRVDAFLHGRLRDMEALAEGGGEIPSILLRSGKAGGASTSIRALCAIYVGQAYAGGVIAAKDSSAASTWLQRGALQLGRNLRDGAGVARDPVNAHVLLTQAANLGNADARNELAELEKTLSADQLARVRRIPPPPALR